MTLRRILLLGWYSAFGIAYGVNPVQAAGWPAAPTPAMTALKPTIFGESTVLPSNVSAAPLLTMPMESLNFGRFAPGNSPGTITITPEGFRTASGGVILLSGDGGHPARFMVRGERDRAFRIKLPDVVQGQGVRLTLTARATGDVLTNGSKTISVGGTLYVPAHTQPGVLNTGFELITDYN